MPREGAIIFADLIGKLDVLRVTCDVCKRDGCYGLARLIRVYGRDAKLRDWLDVITADCPKHAAIIHVAVPSVRNCRRSSCRGNDRRGPNVGP